MNLHESVLVSFDMKYKMRKNDAYFGSEMHSNKKPRIKNDGL